jgi:L-alanine-DL-glutamate epimerase-like enolase superfamily enzyme
MSLGNISESASALHRQALVLDMTMPMLQRSDLKRFWAAMARAWTSLYAILTTSSSWSDRNMSALGPIMSMTCQDARAKALGTSLSRLIGGRVKNPLEVIEVVDIVPYREAAAMAAHFLESAVRCLKVQIAVSEEKLRIYSRIKE